jgi:2-keto-3-deoxy-galactonokinase
MLSLRSLLASSVAVLPGSHANFAPTKRRHVHTFGERSDTRSKAG